MKKLRYLMLMAVAAMVIGITGCSDRNVDTDSKPVESTEIAKEETKTEETEIELEDEVAEDAGVQYMDPVAIEGEYADKVSQRAMMNITYNDLEEYYEVLITWGSSASESTHWEMTAYDDGNTNNLTYEDCACINVTTDEDGNFTSEDVYAGKEGKLTVNEDMSITWIDDYEEEHIFERVPQ